MATRTLSQHEKAAINSILDDAERNFIAPGTGPQDLEALDEQCRGIWTDWDFSVAPTRRTPKRTSEPSRVTPPSHQTSPKSPRVGHQSPERVTRDNSTPKLKFVEPEEEEEEESPRPPVLKPNRKTANPQPTANAARRSRRTSNSSAKQKRADVPIQPFNRADGARFRQDNLGLRRELGRLQAALDRANLEITRLRQEVQRAEQTSAKHKSVIRYLKEEKMYGNK
jgi:hypothetical protein